MGTAYVSDMFQVKWEWQSQTRCQSAGANLRRWSRAEQIGIMENKNREKGAILSHSPTQLAHPLSFPSHCSDLPDALELVTTQLSTASLEAEVADDGPPTPTPTKKLCP
jgi:hypothetical protein